MSTSWGQKKIQDKNIFEIKQYNATTDFHFSEKKKKKPAGVHNAVCFLNKTEFLPFPKFL